MVLFVDEKFNISSLKKHLPGSDFNFILDLIKKREEKKKTVRRIKRLARIEALRNDPRASRQRRRRRRK